MPKKSRFRIPFEIQHANGSQNTCVLCMRALLSYLSSLCGKSSWKMFLLVICEILGLFVNIWTSYDKYSLRNSGILAKLLQMQLKTFSLRKPKKCRFRTPLDSQQAKGFQTVVKSVWEHFYRIFSSLWWKLIWKISLLVICEILGHFVNTFTGDDKYIFCNSENLQQPI